MTFDVTAHPKDKPSEGHTSDSTIHSDCWPRSDSDAKRGIYRTRLEEQEANIRFLRCCYSIFFCEETGGECGSNLYSWLPILLQFHTDLNYFRGAVSFLPKCIPLLTSRFARLIRCNVRPQPLESRWPRMGAARLRTPFQLVRQSGNVTALL